MQRQPSSIEKKIFAGFGFALIVSVLVSLTTYWNNQRLVETRRKAVETQEVLRSLKQMQATVSDAEMGTRGFLLTGDEVFLEPFKAATGRFAPDVQRVRLATRNDPAVQPRLAQLEDLTWAKLQFLARANEARRANGYDPARDLEVLRDSKVRLDAIRSVISDIEGEQLVVLNGLEVAARAGSTVNLMTVLLGGCATGGVLSVFFWFTRLDLG
jgi:CHASE3 domain sensor protein